MTRRQIYLSLILSIIGLVVWVGVAYTSRVVEAWDSIDYYLIGLPLILVAAAVAGYMEPGRPWRWGVFIFILQPIALFIQSKGNPMVFLGVFFFLFLTGMAIGAAYLGKMLRGNTR